jgi:trans-2,3-dihydro-3-hydroxyanthranilate isomerase
VTITLRSPEHLADGTHAWDIEQGYEMGRPSDFHLAVDVHHRRLVAVRMSGQAVPLMEGVRSSPSRISRPTSPPTW